MIENIKSIGNINSILNWQGQLDKAVENNNYETVKKLLENEPISYRDKIFLKEHLYVLALSSADAHYQFTLLESLLSNADLRELLPKPISLSNSLKRACPNYDLLTNAIALLRRKDTTAVNIYQALEESARAGNFPTVNLLLNDFRCDFDMVRKILQEVQEISLASIQSKIPHYQEVRRSLMSAMSARSLERSWQRFGLFYSAGKGGDLGSNISHLPKDILNKIIEQGLPPQLPPRKKPA